MRTFAAAAARNVIKLIGFMVGFALQALGFYKPQRVTVFTLHRVSKDLNGELFVKPEMLRRWIKKISQNYRIIGAEEFAELLQPGKASGGSVERCALLTIDDAFDDCFSTIFPILEELRVPAVLFVPTEFVENPGRVPVSYPCDSSRYRACSWAQLREMVDSGWITLGAHSHRHEVVTKLSSAQIEADCTEHAKIFASNGLPQPSLYAYPRGVYSADAAKVLQNYYSFAFAGAPHHGLDGQLAHMAIPRVPLRGSDAAWAGNLKARGWPTEEERLTEFTKRVVRVVDRGARE